MWHFECYFSPPYATTFSEMHTAYKSMIIHRLSDLYYYPSQQLKSLILIYWNLTTSPKKAPSLICSLTPLQRHVSIKGLISRNILYLRVVIVLPFLWRLFWLLTKGLHPQKLRKLYWHNYICKLNSSEEWKKLWSAVYLGFEFTKKY